MILISVILPAYNVQDTIRESIDSILNQTFMDFELIIINDGSKDKTEEVILSYSDDRIQYYRNEQNKGLIYTLNRGLDLAQGKYIARMDADDIALPTRFEKQIKVMEENPDIVVCGTQIIPFGAERAKRFTSCFREKSEDLKNYLFIQCCFCHPTVMIRRKILVDNEVKYDFDYPYAEDYKMWIDLSLLGKFYNIQEPLLKYRFSDEQVSCKYKDIQYYTATVCRRIYVSYCFKDKKLDQMIIQGVDLNTIQYSKKKGYPKQLIELFYLSLVDYNFKAFLYLLFSFDLFCFKWRICLSIIKRFIVRMDRLL